MKSGYKIEWSENSLLELKRTFEYIESNWTDKEISGLSQKNRKHSKLNFLKP